MMTPRVPDQDYSLAAQYRSSLFYILFALILGSYAYAYTVDQTAERERTKIERRVSERYQEILKQLDRIEDTCCRVKLPTRN